MVILEFTDYEHILLSFSFICDKLIIKVTEYRRRKCIRFGKKKVHSIYQKLHKQELKGCEGDFKYAIDFVKLN